jgi:predicted membrane protein
MARDRNERRQRRVNERPLIGLLIIAAGVLILLRNLDFPFPDFLFTWPMIVILVGFVMALRDGFKPGGWLTVVAVGGFFLALKIFPEFHMSTFFWPAILIAVGLSFVIGWNKMSCRKNRSTTDSNFINEETSFVTGASVDDSNGEDVIDAAAVFGAVKKNIYAKNFKGGDVVTVFGGSEINLMQADFTGQIKIEVVCIFGGATLIIPPHWQIRSEAVAIFGGIEDKRPRPAGVSTDKVVILEGFVMMGGIDIKSKG